jgi:hypothetical protein
MIHGRIVNLRNNLLSKDGTNIIIRIRLPIFRIDLQSNIGIFSLVNLQVKDYALHFIQVSLRDVILQSFDQLLQAGGCF